MKDGVAGLLHGEQAPSADSMQILLFISGGPRCPHRVRLPDRSWRGALVN
ncbi:hypothetical protein [Prevotella denticola]|nr:hypothetical protein [Prevotella denticola]